MGPSQVLTILEFVVLAGVIAYGWYSMYQRHGWKITASLFIGIVILAFILSRLIRE
jgi:hypothetical protein